MKLYINTKDTRKINEWFHECQKNNIFHIVITSKTKYYKLTWDNLTVDLELHSDGYKNLSHPDNIAYITEVFRRVTKYRDKKIYKKPLEAYINYHQGSIDGLSEDEAIDIATELSSYLNNITKPYIKIK